MDFTNDICIVGGAGHVGLPLGLAFADKGHSVLLYDLDVEVLKKIEQGKMPFVEHDAEPVLIEVLNKTLFLTSEIGDVASARFVIVTIGTPVDEHLNPRLRALLELFDTLRPHLDPAQTIIIRSTVYPHTCKQIAQRLNSKGNGPWHVAYCPERIAQGYALRELKELPQLVAGLTDKALADAAQLFASIAPKVIRLTMEEAEMAKLFTNAWRYIQFAVANQFYMIASSFGVDFNQVRKAIVDGYGRAHSLPSAGFAAGPCLLKDTLQLAAFNNNNFTLGHAAMMVNEGLPAFIVEQLRHRFDLGLTRIGILGMAFKADIDDTRDSLSYKLGKILRFYGATVYYSDEYALDPTFISKEELVASSDIVIVGVPHSAYKQLRVPAHVHVIDVWDILSGKESN